MSVLGDRYPPEIRDIVLEAGEQHCMWWSNVDAPGKKPGLGQASDEMSNGVVGSDIEATQGTTSAQPISANRGYSFEGDDVLADTVDLSVDSFTLAIVATHDFSTGTAFILRMIEAGASADGRIQIRDEDGSTAELRAVITDDNGDGGSAVLNGYADTTTRPVVIVATLDFATGRVYLTATHPDVPAASSSASTAASAGATLDTLSVGARADGSFAQTGVQRESLIAPRVLLSDADADALRDRMALRHGIPL